MGYFSAGFEGGLITLAALAIFYEAIQALIHPEELRSVGTGIALIVAAGVVNLGLGWWLLKLGKRTRSLIIEADGHHVLSDSYTSIGVVVGILLVWGTGWQWLDPLVAMGVAVSILWTGYRLMREAAMGLMDRADEGLLDQIVGALQENREEGWLDIHQLRAWKAGDRTFVGYHLVVPGEWTVSQLHKTIDRSRGVLRKVLGPETDVTIHFDAAHPERLRELREGMWDRGVATRIPRVSQETSSA